jgi:nucleoside-triphosphatase
VGAVQGKEVNILITGRPGVGKTTLIKKFIEKSSVPCRGFYTEEMREGGRRTGFLLRTLSGTETVLASVSTRSVHKVGKYGVDLEAFERVGLLPLREALNEGGELIIIDEIGKMELFSPAFREIVERAMDTGRVIATIKSGGNDFVGKIKQRKDVRVVMMTLQNRNDLVKDILEMVGYGLGT